MFWQHLAMFLASNCHNSKHFTVQAKKGSPSSACGVSGACGVLVHVVYLVKPYMYHVHLTICVLSLDSGVCGVSGGVPR